MEHEVEFTGKKQRLVSVKFDRVDRLKSLPSSQRI